MTDLTRGLPDSQVAGAAAAPVMIPSGQVPYSRMARALRNNPRKTLSDENDEVFELAAEMFRAMSAPMRLRIISVLCEGEHNVTELLERIPATQPNMSQHLNTLHNAGLIGRRRDGVQIYYRIVNDRVITLCRAICTQIAIEADLPHP
jgi:DNA-binding transcriptional ArsR family regulator